MKYADALGYIDGFARFSHPASLERIKTILSRLGDPQKSLRFFHVAGTNGKGSTAAYIASVLSFSGEKCGLFISPYVYEFTERIKIDGKNIGKRRLSWAVAKIKDLGVTPDDCTQFELITAAAMLCFKKEKCDTVVLETGLGGRFDATNVIETPLCTVITSVSMDHMNVLGDTLEKIAAEKLGIIKPYGITVISGANKKSVLDMAEKKAAELHNRFITASADDAADVKTGTDGVRFKYKGLELKTGMTGSFQLENAVTALEALFAVCPKLKEQAVINGIFGARLPCRFEVMSQSPAVIVDGAHNEGAMEALVHNLKTLYPEKKIYSVVAMCGDKDYVRVAAKIAAVSEAVFVTDAGNPRSLPTELLAKEARKYCKDITEYRSPRKAFRAAMRRVKKDKSGSAAVVCGSLYLPKAVFGRMGKFKY